MSLSKALKAEPAKVRLTMLAELERLVRHERHAHLSDADRPAGCGGGHLRELFPSMKLEEVLIAFKQIRQGRFDLYGNFTTNVLIDCIRNYEMQNTVTMREQEHVENKKQQVETAAIDWQRLKRLRCRRTAKNAAQGVGPERLYLIPMTKRMQQPRSNTNSKAKRKARRKRSERAILTSRLDRCFSWFVRLRDADSKESMVTCITCGKREHWTQVDAGHFISRKYVAARWMGINVHGQCKGCNESGGQQWLYSS